MSPVPVYLHRDLSYTPPSIVVQALDVCLQNVIRRSDQLDLVIFMIGVATGLLLCPLTDTLPSVLTLREAATPTPGPMSYTKTEKGGSFDVLEKGWGADSEDCDEDDEEDHVQHGIA